MDEEKKDNTSRAIVFVHMRRTCFKLCEELGKDVAIKEQLNPLACVGHGNGIDGMQWQGEQEVVITRFHEGICYRPMEEDEVSLFHNSLQIYILYQFGWHG